MLLLRLLRGSVTLGGALPVVHCADSGGVGLLYSSSILISVKGAWSWDHFSCRGLIAPLKGRWRPAPAARQRCSLHAAPAQARSRAAA